LWSELSVGQVRQNKIFDKVGTNCGPTLGL
jgi:hypothetical protein